MEHNCLRLLSFYLNKPVIKRWTEKGEHVFLDSGAYSAHTKGAQIDVDSYIDYINGLDDTFTCYAQLDTIPGVFRKPKTKEQLLEAPEVSWKNYIYMRERVKSPDKLLPIFHQGEDWHNLTRMLDYEPRIDYMGISPANDVATTIKEGWIRECFKIIEKSKNPLIKTHAFGMTSLRLLERFPFYSADSTSWIMYAVNGMIMTQYGPLVASDRKVKDPGHILNLHPDMGKELEEYIFELCGWTRQELADDYKKRLMYNVLFFKRWADNYTYKPKTVSQARLF